MDRSTSQVCHGRTRMIVFPLTRSFGVEGGDSDIEGIHVANPLDDLTQWDTTTKSIPRAVRGPCFRRPGNGHQRSSGPDQAVEARTLASLPGDVDFTVGAGVAMTNFPSPRPHQSP
jgi:hypothetical protein